LSQISTGGMTVDHLDAVSRPHSISGNLVHHGCSRNEFYEYKASAEKLCQVGCMMENLGCKGTQAAGDCNTRAWNGSGSCISGGYPCIACTEPGFEEPGHPFAETPKIAGIPIGLPTDMPKAWFVALSSLSKAATPRRLRENASSDRLNVYPERKKTGRKL
ncbi:MAG TPA: HupU protein, partial [Octadecabacter sp.]|nr:HupU protein [Octadecabacter sp.]